MITLGLLVVRQTGLVTILRLDVRTGRRELRSGYNVLARCLCSLESCPSALKWGSRLNAVKRYRLFGVEDPRPVASCRARRMNL